MRALSKGEIPILEEGLPALVAEGLASGRLRFVVGAPVAARGAEFVFLCVQTPQSESGAADLSAVEAVAREIAPVLQPGAVVVNKSTMPVGSTLLVARELSQAGAANDVGVASNPEFLREGTAVRDFLQPSRVVIGCDDAAVAVRVSELYRDVQAPILVTDPASAEMIKYASNAFLATKISFINAIANLCEAVNADVREVALGMGYDPRIGFEFLHPGPGYGGSCFPKDTAALIHTAELAGYDFSLLRGVVEVNRAPARAHHREAARRGRRIARRCHGRGVGPHLQGQHRRPARLAGARRVPSGCSTKVRVVRAYDPAAGEAAAAQLPGLEVVDRPVRRGARARRCSRSSPSGTSSAGSTSAGSPTTMAPPRALVDARNLLDPAAMRRRGFAYQGVGR